MTHLSEAERQELADRTISGTQAAALAAHMAECVECAADVARLRSIVERVRDVPAPVPPEQLDLAWPAIRARIEAAKVRALLPPDARPEGARRVRRVAWAAAAIAAAACVAVGIHVRNRDAIPPAIAPNAPAALRPAVDSQVTSQADIQRLLDEIELEKAMLPPATAAVADSDLRAIDSAIADLRDALARDPNNPAIRQLLAESYRQQQDLLKRLHNAS
jgi:anti-sigma factor RsiW